MREKLCGTWSGSSAESHPGHRHALSVITTGLLVMAGFWQWTLGVFPTGRPSCDEEGHNRHRPVQMIDAP
jgi:hypothetical protein